MTKFDDAPVSNGALMYVRALDGSPLPVTQSMLGGGTGGSSAPPLTLTTTTKTSSGTVAAGAYQLLFDNVGTLDCTVAGKTLKPGSALPLESAGSYAAVPYTVPSGGSLEITEGR